MEPQTLHLDAVTLVVRRAEVAEIIPLRHRILRAGMPVEAAHFTGDREASTIHVAAFRGAEAAGCASFMLNQWQSEPAWQLRGMATDAGLQGRGIGRDVLAYITALAREAQPGVRVLWCNARVPAMRFYERERWQIMSDEFEIPTAGPHRRLMRRV